MRIKRHTDSYGFYQGILDTSIFQINPPLYLVGKKIWCWRCENKMSVVAILAPHVEDTENQVCLLTDIVQLPEDVLFYIQKRVPTFKFKFSKTAGQKYYANTCPNCGVLSGDFYLHSEPEAPFFPTEEEEAQSLYMTEIPLSNPIEAKASLSIGVGELILNNAKKIT